MADVQLTEDDIEGASLRGRNPKKLTIPELRFWLACRKILSSKLKTKAELLVRVQTLLDSGEYRDVVDPTEGQTYMKRKLNDQKPAGNTDDDSIHTDLTAPSTGWVKSIPVDILSNFGDVNIKEYSLNSGKRAFKMTSSQPRKKTCIRPETRGYQFFCEKYFHDIWSVKHDEHIFFKSKCFASQKKNDKPHSLWCAIKCDTLDVTKALCSCCAGLSGYCNHVLGLLYQISHFSHYAMATIPDDMAKTSLPQTWHKPRIEGILAEPIMEVTPRIAGMPAKGSRQTVSTLYEARHPGNIVNDGMLLEDVQRILAAENPLYGVTYMASADTSTTTYCPMQLGTFVPRGSLLSYQLALTEGNFHAECNSLSFEKFKCRESCVMRNVSYPELPLNDLQTYIISNTLSTEIRAKLESLALTRDQIVNVEMTTRDQANSDLWWSEREFRLTASSFAELCRRKKKNCEKLAGYSSIYSLHSFPYQMPWGYHRQLHILLCSC